MAENQKQRRGLQVEEDRPWQETLWTAQRVGWAIMALLIVAALIGITGKGGPVASASASVAGATIEYPRITRWQSQDQLVVRLPPSASGEAEVELSRAFGDLFTVESVQPEPSKVEATGTGYRYAFDVRGGGEKLVRFNIKANRPVLWRAVEASIGDAPPARLGVIVLP